jgi:hypothetical protein
MPFPNNEGATYFSKCFHRDTLFTLNFRNTYTHICWNIFFNFCFLESSLKTYICMYVWQNVFFTFERVVALTTRSLLKNTYLLTWTDFFCREINTSDGFKRRWLLSNLGGRFLTFFWEIALLENKERDEVTHRYSKTNLMDWIFLQILSDTIRYYQILSDTIRYYQILSDTIRYYQILSDTIRYY